MHHSNSSSKTLRPKGNIEKLFNKAFAPPETPTVTPSTSMSPLNLRHPAAPEHPMPLALPLDSQGSATPQGGSLDPLWDEVRQSKELASSSARVQSLEATSPTVQHSPSSRKVTNRKSSVNFKESTDRKSVTATFDIPGVRKQDMHVSFSASRLVVSWRTMKVVESREGEVLVREREEKKSSQIIPLPEGTKFDEIKATRDGRHLILTYPNFRCVRCGQHTPKTALSAGTDFYSC